MSRRGGRGRSRYSSAPPAPRNFEPPRISSKPAEDAEPERRITLFYIDDVEFSAPATLPPSIGLRYLADLRDGGNADFAVAGLLIDAMGRKAFDALADCDTVTSDDMAAIVDKVLEIALGGTGQGKS